MCGRSFLRWDTTGSFQRALSFSLRNCATLRSSGSDPASGGTSRPCPALALRATCPSLAVTSPFLGCLCSACPRLSGVSAPWPLERSALQGQPRKALPAHYPQVTHLSPDCGEVSQGGGLSWLPRKVRVAKPPAGLEPATLQSPIFLGRSTY